MMDENPKDKIQNPKNKGQSILSLTEPYPNWIQQFFIA
jgi:hypothetical protein